MNAEIITVGTELLLGEIVNTNAKFLSEGLASCGISTFYQSTVGDNKSRLKKALQLALSRSDLVILTGGLGPTDDDITKQTISEALGIPLRLHQKSLDRIRDYFDRSGREMTQNNVCQAMLPEGAVVFANENGTAPGCAVCSERQCVILLPGPPRELEPMFNNYVKPFLMQYSDKVFVSHAVNVFGIGESKVADMLGDIFSGSNPTVGIYAGAGEVRLRVTAAADTAEEAEKMCRPMLERILQTVGENAYGIDRTGLEQVVVEELSRHGLLLATAESCTAGLVSKRITDIPGSSEVFHMGVAAYSNDIKTKVLHVPADVIEENGAVSDIVAQYMAAGVRDISGADIGVGITGVAGGSIEDKPSGLVYIAICDRQHVWVRKITSGRNPDERDYVRHLAASHALDMVRRYIDALPGIMDGAQPLPEAHVPAEEHELTENQMHVDGQQPAEERKSGIFIADFDPDKLAFADDIGDAAEDYSEEQAYIGEDADNDALDTEAEDSGAITDDSFNDNSADGEDALDGNVSYIQPSDFAETPDDDFSIDLFSDSNADEEPAKDASASKKAADILRGDGDVEFGADGSIDVPGKNGEKKSPAIVRFFKHIIPWKGDPTREIVRKSVFLVCLAALIVSGIYLGGRLIEKWRNDRAIDEIRGLYDPTDMSVEDDGRLSRFNALLERNSEVIGWLKVPGTTTDNPVYQTIDNDYYISHDMDKNPSVYGALFADYRDSITVNGNNQNVVVYGHHMRDGSMMGELGKYGDIEFYKTNPVVTFDTLYKRGSYKVFAAFITNAEPSGDNGYFFDYCIPSFASESDFLAWIEQVRRRSLINTTVDVLGDDEILTMSTCTYQLRGVELRFVVMARRVRDGESEAVNVADAEQNANPLYPAIWYQRRGGSKPVFDDGLYTWYPGGYYQEYVVDIPDTDVSSEAVSDSSDESQPPEDSSGEAASSQAPPAVSSAAPPVSSEAPPVSSEEPAASSETPPVSSEEPAASSDDTSASEEAAA